MTSELRFSLQVYATSNDLNNYTISVLIKNPDDALHTEHLYEMTRSDFERDPTTVMRNVMDAWRKVKT